MADTSATFTAWLKDARTAAGLSQQKVADALKAQGFTVFLQTTVAKIESGQRPVLLDEAVAFAELFGTTLDAALGLVAGSASAPSWTEIRRTALLQHIAALIEAELGGGA